MAPLTSVVVGILLAVWMPSEPSSEQNPLPHTPAADFSLEYGQTCSGLEPSECCAQQLELASFRASGDQLPRLLKSLVRLACNDDRRVMAPQACRNIAVMRGFRGRDADAICGPARTQCGSDKACAECTAELHKLGYRGAHHVCRPLTYVKPARAGWR